MRLTSASPKLKRLSNFAGNAMKNLRYVLLFFCVLCLRQPLSSSVIVAPMLKKGDTIAFVAPASSPDEDQRDVTRTVKMLVNKGYKVKLSPNLMSRRGYLAGSDAERAKAFMDAWTDPEVKAVWCFRGGFGSTRILDKIDFDKIKKCPKIFIGMSDVTALHAAINGYTGIITFLGPNVNGVFGKDDSSDSLYSQAQLWNLIAPRVPFLEAGYRIPYPKTFPAQGQPFKAIKTGVARGRLTGGTLSIVSALVGTPWEIDTTGKILVLEDVNEEPFRIDRMLRQLKHAGLLDQPAGVILCSWKGCIGTRPDKTLTMEQIFRDYFGEASYPVLYGFPSGHVADQATLPLNALAELDAVMKTVRILETPVTVGR